MVAYQATKDGSRLFKKSKHGFENLFRLEGEGGLFTEEADGTFKPVRNLSKIYNGIGYEAYYRKQDFKK